MRPLCPLFSLLLLTAMLPAHADDAMPLPLVEEHVDAIVFAQFPGGARVLFLRHGRLLADRWCHADMQLTIAPQAAAPFELHWLDCGTCDRIVRSPRIVLLACDLDPLSDAGGEWWFQNRRMTDLRAP